MAAYWKLSVVLLQARGRQGCATLQRIRLSQSKGLRAKQRSGKVPGSEFVARINDLGCNALVVLAQAVAPSFWIRCNGAHFVARGMREVQCNEFSRSFHRKIGQARWNGEPIRRNPSAAGWEVLIRRRTDRLAVCGRAHGYRMPAPKPSARLSSPAPWLDDCSRWAARPAPCVR